MEFPFVVILDLADCRLLYFKTSISQTYAIQNIPRLCSLALGSTSGQRGACFRSALDGVDARSIFAAAARTAGLVFVGVFLSGGGRPTADIVLNYALSFCLEVPQCDVFECCYFRASLCCLGEELCNVFLLSRRICLAIGLKSAVMPTRAVMPSRISVTILLTLKSIKS